MCTFVFTQSTHFLVVFQSNLCILDRNILMTSITKIRSFGAELLHAHGRQADTTNIFAILRMRLEMESV